MAQVENSSFAPWDDPTARPLIRFDSVTKRFGTFTAIEDLNLSIYPREFFALLGPSGCGKTTMMRMLAGFETPSAGSIHLDGADIGHVPPHLRPVNMMFQSYALFPHLSVWDNIAFGLRRDGWAKDRLAARVEEMLRLARLEKFARRKPDQISGGQKQRVALARALARAPKLLLLDEPLAALDKKLRHETQFELMDIQEKTGTTFVIVTHDQEEAMTVASRIAVMDHGKLVQVSTPAGIYEAPNSVYVADFIGEVNVLPSTVAALEPGFCALQWAEGSCHLRAACEAGLSQGQRISYAIRPEKIDVSATPSEGQSNCLKGRVVDIAYVGSISIYHVEVAQGVTIKTQTTNAHRLSRRDFTRDDEVWLSWADTAGLVLTR
ncbi:ABC transporter ATP-binding protein [Mesorhizobium sp. M2A.F.Ca.ET.039.01.1.1]|uniref:ABC transporter ATP-binding protein n=1 Tax=Mesorhizobium sp. M2A.F.Ca.ET.039.01.1.1 TaxID=2496746 RepID=UPI000FCA8C90|nr:ABC transporter ATP-binding protein [Mesorhizobium sp. M2A.F.Ca.ET.039.01.1.1]RWX70672.1 polyamine ABC transporter ATP-binding protein [Mesorhizobium sp. M2A.F.Ca.ET.039.01.1.1]